MTEDARTTEKVETKSSSEQMFQSKDIIAGADYSPDWEEDETPLTHETTKPTTKQTRSKQTEIKQPEIKHLTNREKKNIIIGLAIFLAVGTALVRFFTH